MLLTAMMLAQVTPAATTPIATQATASEKKTCRRLDVTGSIIPFKRVCRTPTEWAQFDAETAAAYEGARYKRLRTYIRSQPGD